MTTERNIIIVANGGDRTVGQLLMNELDKKYSVKASIWSNSNFKANSHQISNSQVIICVGGPGYNDITKEYDNITGLVNQANKYSIKINNRIALVYGFGSSDSTKDALQSFIKNNLKKFVEDNFPKPKPKPKKKTTPKQPKPTPTQPDQPADTRTQPDPMPPVPPAPEYENYSKAFYCSGDKIWTIKFDGKMRNFREKHGLKYIHHILSNPGKTINFEELYKIIYPSSSLSDIGNLDFETKEEHNKGIPLNVSSLEAFSRSDLERRLNENRKVIEKLKKDNVDLKDEVEKQTPIFEDSKSRWKNIKLDEQMKREAGKLYTVTQKMKAHTLVETAFNFMNEIKKKIDESNTKVQSNKIEISTISKTNNQIALKLNKGWGEHTKEYDNVRTTIYHNIDDCLESFQNQGLNSFIRYWKSFVDYKEGVYQYTPENGSESWKLDK